MAKNTTTTAKTTARATSAAPEGWEKVQTDRPMWKPEDKAPVRGILIGLLDMPPTRDGKAWRAFILRTTASTVVHRGADGGAEDCEAGEEVMVPATTTLAQSLSRPASHPSLAFEVQIEPLEQVKARVGRRWTYAIHVNPRPVPRTGGMRLMAAAAAPPALPARAEDTTDEIPF